MSQPRDKDGRFLSPELEKNPLVEYARKELALIEAQCHDHSDLEDQQRISQQILAIIKTFAGQDHSGFSAGYVHRMIDRLLDWKPITCLTGEESEWDEPTIEGAGRQNKRCFTVFLQPDGKAYDQNTFVYSDDGGKTWFSRGARGTKPIKFPYYPPLEPKFIYLDRHGHRIPRWWAKVIFR